MFNVTVRFICNSIYENGKLIDIDSVSNFIYGIDFRKVLKDDRDKIMKEMENPIVGHVLDEVIAQVVSNHKTCITNFLNGTIKKFRVRTLKYNRKKLILKFEPDRFYNGTFRGSLNGMAASESLDVTSTSTLQFNKSTGKYILFVPTTVEKKLRESNTIDAGIDIGVRDFVSIYSENKVIIMGSDVSKKLEKNNRKIDKIKKILNYPPSRKYNMVIKKKVIKEQGKKIVKNVIVPKTIKKTSLRKALRKYNRKNINLIKDMHYKIAKYLVNNFDTIYIGKISTSIILSNKNNTISKNTKRILKILSPYKFIRILIYMGNKYGVDVIKVNEYLTTKTCSQCGKIKNLKDKKIYECKCGMIADRDINAAKNMLKVGYLNNENHDKEILLQKTNNTIVIYNKKTKEYEIY